MPFYGELLSLFGYFTTQQQIEFYQNRAKLHAAVRDDESKMTWMAKDLAECHEGRNENTGRCKKLKENYDVLYENHYGKMATALEASPTPESNIAMMRKYSDRIDTHREAYASTQRLFNSKKKNDERHMWNLADLLFDCHAGDHAESAECRKMKQQYDALYQKHYE